MALALLNLENAERQAKRTVFGHALFVVVCCALALVLRRFFRFPPQLSWTVFAIPLVVFSGDIIRWRWRLHRLKQARAKRFAD